MSFASAGWRNLRDGPHGTPDTERAHPPARGFASRRDGATPPPISSRQTSSASRQIANRIRLRRRAKRHHRDPAPAPRREPLDPRAQASRSADCRQHTHAACTNRLRSSRGPAFVMCPRCRRSAELSSRGTSPIAALTWPASANRSASSTNARNVSATIGPTPGHRLQAAATTGSPRRASPAARPSRRSPWSASRSAARNGASVSASAAGSASARQPRAARVSAAAARQPIARLAAATRAADVIVPDRICTSCRRLRSICRVARCAADDAMRRAIPPAAIRLRQRRHIPPIRFHLAPAARHTSARNSDRRRSPRGPRPRAPAPPTRSPSPSRAASASARDPRTPSSIARASSAPAARAAPRPSSSTIRIWLYRMCRSMAP